MVNSLVQDSPGLHVIINNLNPNDKESLMWVGLLGWKIIQDEKQSLAYQMCASPLWEGIESQLWGGLYSHVPLSPMETFVDYLFHLHIISYHIISHKIIEIVFIETLNVILRPTDTVSQMISKIWLSILRVKTYNTLSQNSSKFCVPVAKNFKRKSY